MMRQRKTWRSVSVWLVLLAMAGCTSSKTPPVPPEKDRPASAAGEPSQAPSDEPDGAKGTPEPQTPAPGAGTESKGQANRVLLGSPELTAGIPGEGTLTLDRIEKWLAQEENHVPLEVELPYGLAAAGQMAIHGLDANPLTRAKIELGRQLYFDTRLSADTTVSCASCHDPDEGYTRHTQFGVGIKDQQGGRNSPVSYNRILSGAQFWDGRAASLEDQAKGPIANPIEMGNTHEACVKCIESVDGYRVQFEKVFGGVTIDAVAQAIASFERAVVTGPAPADHWEFARSVQKRFDEDEIKALEQDDPELYQRYQDALAGSKDMSEGAKRGREIFFSNRGNCTACHVGANFTDEKYHNLGVGMDAEKPDLGRYEVTKDDKDRGAFKTPTIRNVSLSAPYMHDGSQKTLQEVVAWYAKGGHPNDHLSEKVKKLDLTDQDKADLVEYMKALTSAFPKVERGRLPE